jgi:4-amino-4-deoxy-L-arabinose transferase-like glycosyltransferase
MSSVVRLPAERAAIAPLSLAWLQSPLVLTALWCLAFLPFAAQFLTFHPDERHYLDAALQMGMTGDYLTPRYPDGSLRFNKPIVTYWLIVPWRWLLGSTPLAGRIAFLGLSGVVVLLVERLAWLVYRDRRTSLIALCLMVSHVPLITVAVNSIPEVPLTVCWVLCSLGFVAIAVCQRREPIWHWAAYGGAGLGVAVKGLPILVLVAYAIAFALVNPWRRTRIRELIHFPSMTAAVVLGGWWYVAMYALHGDFALQSFMNDQVHERVGYSPKRIGLNLLLVAGGYALACFPWTLPLIAARYVRKSPPSTKFSEPVEQKLFVQFVIGWAIAMGLVTAMVDRFALRYLLAVTPLMSVVLAHQMASLRGQWIHAWWQWSGRLLAGLIVVATFSMLVVRGQMIGDWLVVAGLAIAIVGAGLALAHRLAIEPPLRLTAAGLVLLPLAYLTLAPIGLPDSGQVLAEHLEAGHWLDRSLVHVGRPALAAKSRLRTNGDMRLYTLVDADDFAVVEYDYVIIDAQTAKDLPHRAFDVVAEFDSGYRGIAPGDAVVAALTGRLNEYLGDHPQRYQFLANRDRIASTTR